MKNALILAALAVAGVVVYRRSSAPPPPPPGGYGGSGTGAKVGSLFDSLWANVSALRSDVRDIAGALGPKPEDGTLNDAPGVGYTTRTDARGTTYSRRTSAVVWPNDSNYTATVLQTK